MCLSDQVVHLSILMLIHRAVPLRTNRVTMLTNECIDSVRAALESHHRCVRVFGESQSLFLSAYLSWYVPSAINIFICQEHSLKFTVGSQGNPLLPFCTFHGIILPRD
ncbi:hypothetical protein B0J13DRAFT_132050 [Dactylonectria estremocensis]|uniref:Uncharacterized protein n=1 Tax=Dactylonectria estremocensis TaxID=1079267 RepID=A0A9P9E2W5_9HYPO|nr:hypothetical protein B0J13DRAFT_132050 [Dactylonectria estremocensis]